MKGCPLLQLQNRAVAGVVVQDFLRRGYVGVDGELAADAALLVVVANRNFGSQVFGNLLLIGLQISGFFLLDFFKIEMLFYTSYKGGLSERNNNKDKVFLTG